MVNDVYVLSGMQLMNVMWQTAR